MSSTATAGAAVVTVISPDSVVVIETVVVTTQYYTEDAAPATASSDDLASSAAASSTVTTTADSSIVTTQTNSPAYVAVSSTTSFVASSTSISTSTSALTATSTSTSTSTSSTQTLAFASSVTSSIDGSVLSTALITSTILSLSSQLPVQTDVHSTSTSGVPWSSTVSTIATPAASSTSFGPQVGSNAHRQAVIGGLAGAIGGTTLIGLLLLLCCCCRRRRKRDPDSEKQFLNPQRPPLMTGQSSFAPIPYLAGQRQGSPRSFRTADGNVIQLSLEHFSRPFVDKEGWRESVGPRQLRCMNPDNSVPCTPDVASEQMTGFFNRYRTSPPMLAPVVLAPERSKLPVVFVDEALSKECIVSSIEKSPSYKPFPSVHTTPVVIRQTPPEDPFRARTPGDYKTYRPDQTPRQGVAGRRSNTRGNVLQPMKYKSATASPQSLRQSASNYSARSSQRSFSGTDPWELESPELRQGNRFVIQNGVNSKVHVSFA